MSSPHFNHKMAVRFFQMLPISWPSTKAKEAGIEKSIIDEAETTLESLSASKKLQQAMKSRDPTALVQAGWDDGMTNQMDLLREFPGKMDDHRFFAI